MDSLLDYWTWIGSLCGRVSLVSLTALEKEAQSPVVTLSVSFPDSKYYEKERYWQTLCLWPHLGFSSR